MIALGLDSVEELAEAIYLAEQTAIALAAGKTPRGGLWLDLNPAHRELKITAARRLLELYRVEGMSLGSTDR